MPLLLALRVMRCVALDHSGNCDLMTSPCISFININSGIIEKRTRINSRGGGGRIPLYKLYRYVPPQRVWFLSRFGLKTGIDFDNYGLKSGMVFKGTTGAYKRICLFNSK